MTHLSKTPGEKCPSCRQHLELTLRFNRNLNEIYETLEYVKCAICDFKKDDQEQEGLVGIPIQEMIKHLKEDCLSMDVKCF
jgi:hypothetical protein